MSRRVAMLEGLLKSNDLDKKKSRQIDLVTVESLWL